MNDKINRIIEAHLKDRAGSNYVKPLLTDSEALPYYHDQEQTYTDLTQMDSTHGANSSDYNLKRYVFPDTQTYNPDWASGDFLSPYKNDLQIFFNETPNTPETLYDPAMDGGAINQLSVVSYFNDCIEDLNSRTSSAIDGFLTENKNLIKVSSSLDLSDFLKRSDDTLIHKSSKDIWKVLKDKDGNVFIKRLVEEDFLKEE